VDTRGARDVFVAGFLRKLIQHQKLISEEPKLRDVLRISNACGAITTIERGVISALLDTETAEKLINQATLY
jgi:fructokinase